MSDVLRVLLVEDNQGDADLIDELLPKGGGMGFAIHCVPRLAAALEQVKTDSFDVILLDLGLPDSTGLDTLLAMRKEAADMPIVVLTGIDDGRMGLAAIQQGAQDYLVKGHAYAALLPRILRYAAERHRNEQSLLLSEAKYRLLADNLMDWVCWVAADGRSVYQSPACEGVTGYRADEFAADPSLLTRLIHPDDQARYLNRVADPLNTDGASWYLRLIRRDGALRWIENTSRSTFDGKGCHVGNSGINRDITEHRMIEDRLRQAATVFENTSEGIIVTDARERILLINQAFCELTGYTEKEVLGRKPRMLKSGRHDLYFYTAMWAEINTTGHWRGEIWNRRKNGEIYPELLCISVVRDDSGEITHYVGIFTDLSGLKDSEAKLEYLAHHDPLTELPNRILLGFHLEHSIELARREGRNLALLVMDLDHFKDVNDSFGHLIGDELLKSVPSRLLHRLRSTDMLSRLGGDEFAVLLVNISQPQDAIPVAQEIIRALAETWRLSNGIEVHVGTSIGISLFPEQGQTADELLSQADAALYKAKSAGRGTFRFFSNDLTQAARERIVLETQLRQAIAEAELRVYYQAQIDIATGSIIGAEALVRWQHPIKGLTLPNCFIPMAEETGLIGLLGEWVLRETCRQGRQWIDAGLPPISLAVNISAHQLRHADIKTTVSAVLAETGFPAEKLELELTERTLMQHELEAVAILQSLQDMGVRLSIDDFGTGYSSLAYLKLFPLDTLKIDKQFIDDIPNGQSDMEITAAIIAMAHALHLKVLAEGVETLAQLEFLKKQGCDRYQGYYHSHPLPAEEFACLLLQESQ